MVYKIVMVQDAFLRMLIKYFINSILMIFTDYNLFMILGTQTHYKRAYINHTFRVV